MEMMSAFFENSNIVGQKWCFYYRFGHQ